MRRTRLLSVLGLSCAAAAAAVVIPVIANSAASDYNLPDLVSVAPPSGSAYLIEGAFAGDPEEETSDPRGPRLLVRFDGFVDNVGDGPVHFEGNPSARTVKQYVEPKGAPGTLVLPTGADTIQAPSATYPKNNDAEKLGQCVNLGDDGDPSTPFSGNSATGKPTFGPCFIYSSTDSEASSDGHNHWHMVAAARYSLWNSASTAQVAPGQKVGFCLYDYDEIPGYSGRPAREYGYTAPSDNFCQALDPENNPGGGPSATTLTEGINWGWRDVYGSYLAWQWLDVTDVQPGQYRLGGEVDPSNRVWEKAGQEQNGVDRSGLFTIPGFLAKAQSTSTGVGQAKVITLDATRYGGSCFKVNFDGAGCSYYTPPNGNRRFRIVDPPDNGTLNVAVNSPFAGPTVTYTPNPGYTGGVDTFSFTAEDNASEYPRTRQAAAVAVTVGNGSPVGVAISGNPSSLVTSTSAQLNASLTNASGGVTWSVNGAHGGNATVGTVSPTGLYTAPAAVPVGGVVVVRATSVSVPSVFAEVAIGIVAPPTPTPQPLPLEPTPATPTTPTTPASPTNPPPSGTTRGTARVTVARPTVARIGGRVIIRITPRFNGRLGITVMQGRKRIGQCVFRKATARRSVVCYVRTPNGRRLLNARVITVLQTPKGRARSVVTRNRL